MYLDSQMIQKPKNNKKQQQQHQNNKRKTNKPDNLRVERLYAPRDVYEETADLEQPILHSSVSSFLL